MTTAITRAQDLALQLAEGLAREADAPNTRRAYERGLEDFRSACDRLGLPSAVPASPEVIVAYIGDLAARGAATATVRVRLAAVRRAHRDAGEPTPTEDELVRRVLRGYRRASAGRPPRKAKPLSGAQVRACIVHPKTPRRDRAILAMGFVSGLRRSEIVALEWSDVETTDRGIVLTVRRSKADQDGEGAKVGLPYSDDPRVCPVRLLEIWRAEGDGVGPVFPVKAQTVSKAIKRAAARIGLDPSLYSAHSLRAGLATTAAEAGVSLAESMLATRHKSANVAASYVRQTEALTNAAHRAAVEALNG